MKKSQLIMLTAFVLALSIGVSTHAETTSINTNTEINETNRNTGIKAESNSEVSVSKDNRTSRDRAVADLDQRIESLNKLEAKVVAMKHVSDAGETSIKTMIDAQRTSLMTLRAKILADTDPLVLKADIASISKAYRIYMLVIPQGAILATADRIVTSADLMTTFGAKLETRINEAEKSGIDVTAMKSAYADYKLQINEAKLQASAAVALVATLKPDNGDTTIATANKKALTDARAKIKAGQEDLRQARKDADTIIKGLKSVGLKGEAKFKLNEKAEASKNNDD